MAGLRLSYPRSIVCRARPAARRLRARAAQAFARERGRAQPDLILEPTLLNMRYDRKQSAADTLHDVRQVYDPRYGIWVLRELATRPDGTILWRLRHEAEPGAVFGRLVYFEEEVPAADAAEQARAALAPSVPVDRLSDNGGSSLALKVSKAAVSFQRHAEEEAMMLAEAQRRHAQEPRVSPSEIVIRQKEYAWPAGTTMLGPPFDPTPYREEITRLTREMPYLRRLLAGHGGKRALFTSPDGKTWTLQTQRLSERTAQIAHRARIAHGFGLPEHQNWATTKGEIRRRLLPRANQLLQLASVRRLLDEALAAGQRALVIGPFVFWYETDGDLGWLVKQLGSAKGDTGPDTEAAWEEGTIVSKNHGRVVVLPFRKANGERVTGYTRNVSGDGPAKPRHPTQYVEIPFRRLERDLMIGLFGELPYE